MVKLTKIYTRKGDQGETSLANRRRVAKDDPRVAAYGTVDEANAAIGVARLHAGAAAAEALARVQNDLFDLGADLSTPIKKGEKGALRITESQVRWLEEQIDFLNAELAPLRSFVLPGGTAASAGLHMARTIVRRAEREAVALKRREALNDQSLKYLNRLSDYLFVLARHLNGKGEKDVLWVPGKSRKS